ncbi:MAG: SDR family NAD(P)-dependent oxidoreductase, partial [Rhodoferax sp.]
MPLPFQNTVLTGACGGLGQELARQLLDQGSVVALVGLNRSALEALAVTAPHRCAVYTPDVADPHAMHACAQDWVGRFGVPDLLIANAGVAGGFDTAQ